MNTLLIALALLGAGCKPKPIVRVEIKQVSNYAGQDGWVWWAYYSHDGVYYGDGISYGDGWKTCDEAKEDWLHGHWLYGKFYSEREQIEKAGNDWKITIDCPDPDRV